MSLTYVVTGASRGIGLEFVKQISAKGHNVFALARDPEGSEGLKGLVDNNKVFALKADTTCERSLKEAAEHVKNSSPEGIDVLINNAGIGGEITKDIYLKVFETNVTGVIDTTYAFLPSLRQRGKDKTKKIFNISSVIGSMTDVGMANPACRMPALCASKAALNMITKLHANHLAKENFVVAAAYLGWLKTDFGGKNSYLEPKDSIEGLLKVLDGLSAKENGAFIDYQGKKLKW